MFMRTLSASALLACGCSRGVDDGSRCVNWPVMGTTASLHARDDPGGAWSGAFAVEAMAVFRDVETLLNAHSPTSEVSRLANLPRDGLLAACSGWTRPCYAAAFALSEAAGGAFNPRWRGAATLDLGAIAKGFAVDLAAAACAKRCPPGALLVDLGGNLKSAKGSWRVGVKNPNGAACAATVELHEGEALATSATYFRGRHIYDGRTGAAVSNGVASVTVLAPSAMWADGLSTTLFVLGPDAGRAFLASRLHGLCGDAGVAVLWVMGDGSAIARDPDGRFRL